MRVKLALMAFLSINAFVFLVPMMPELRALAAAAGLHRSGEEPDPAHRPRRGAQSVRPAVMDWLATLG
jgi:hypothetical protein